MGKDKSREAKPVSGSVQNGVIGLILILCGIGVLLLGNFKPELKKDSDIIYSSLLIVTGIVSFFAYDPTGNPAIFLEKILLSGMCLFLVIENFQKRTPNQDNNRSFAERGRDDDRAGRRNYRAERAPEYDEFPPQPRGGAGLRGGYPEPNDNNDPGYGDRALPRRDVDARSGGRRDRPNRSARFEENDAPIGRDDSYGEPRQIPGRSGNSRPDDRMNGGDRGGARPSDAPRRRQPDEAAPRRRPRPDRVEDINSDAVDDIPSADYVDFTPIESTERPASNSWGPNG
jgi:hypothetical protein